MASRDAADATLETGCAATPTLAVTAMPAGLDAVTASRSRVAKSTTACAGQIVTTMNSSPPERPTVFPRIDSPTNALARSTSTRSPVPWPY
ncbi:Uncharacterised protein [Mycobacteroides abscessus subsp. massiliense]|nr:Uncharacterised protein [Mycobacteroides abscessus subsp. massiliense]